MNKQQFIFSLIIYLYMFPLSLSADVKFNYSDRLVELYDNAIELNDKKDYLKAFRSILDTEKLMREELNVQHITPNQLDDNSFKYPYWTILKSKAEIAYMIANHEAMGEVEKELADGLELRNKNVDELCSDLEKIRGSRFALLHNYVSAETCLVKSLKLRKEREEFDFFPFIVPVREDLAQVYYNQKKYVEALAQLDYLLKHPKMDCDNRTPNIEVENKRLFYMKAIILARMGRYDDALLLTDANMEKINAHENVRDYAELLRIKGKILMLQYDATGIFNPVAKDCYTEYLKMSKDFIDENFVGMTESEREQYWMAEQPFATDCYRLEDKAPSLIYDVALFSKAVLLQMGRDFKPDMSLEQKRGKLDMVRVGWKDIRNKLEYGCVAVEFLQYERDGREYLGALVLGKTSKEPDFVRITPLEMIKKHKLREGLTVEDAMHAPGRGDSDNEKDLLYSDSILSAMIWNADLVEAIGDSQRVYFSPDGILHLLALEYLLPESMKGKRLFRLTSTRLLTEERKPFSSESVLLCGGVNYVAQSGCTSAFDNDAFAYTSMKNVGVGLPFLPGTLAEVDSIVSVRHNSSDKLLCGLESTEAALRTMASRFNIIHLATHGCFEAASSEGTDLRSASTDDQLSRCCLFLSGAQQNLNDSSFDVRNPDGLLSARELAGMDLSNVALVVMSACQSGLGYLTLDGVFGLQRGLKTAGVRAVIASMWEVDDKSTVLFMKALYEGLLRGKTLHIAFDDAREYLRNNEFERKRRRAGLRDLTVKQRFNQPRFCDAFILIDALE